MKRRPLKNGDAKFFYDYMLVFIIVVLLVFGLMMIYSASSYKAQDKFGDPMYFLKRQAIISLAGDRKSVV